MLVEWDPTKAQRNLRKHGVSFADAALALEDELALTIDDTYETESLFVTTGVDPHGRLLVVIFTWRADRIRLISARKANARERSDYLNRSRPG